MTEEYRLPEEDGIYPILDKRKLLMPKQCKIIGSRDTDDPYRPMIILEFDFGIYETDLNRKQMRILVSNLSKIRKNWIGRKLVIKAVIYSDENGHPLLNKKGEKCLTLVIERCF